MFKHLSDSEQDFSTGDEIATNAGNCKTLKCIIRVSIYNTYLE